MAAVLAADARISQHLSETQIETMLDPTRYTGLSSQLAETQAARARELAAKLSAG
ncbi:MAG: hypothetical protein QF512_08355 [Alphaproteobacteria bacterium]|nr:hypothetical protein [Alphaproteobacteria bacterium]